MLRSDPPDSHYQPERKRGAEPCEQGQGSRDGPATDAGRRGGRGGGSKGGRSVTFGRGGKGHRVAVVIVRADQVVLLEQLVVHAPAEDRLHCVEGKQGQAGSGQTDAGEAPPKLPASSEHSRLTQAFLRTPRPF